jgi:hypothetical protein
MKRVSGIFLLGAVLMSYGMSAPVVDERRPNFLIVMVDDVSPEQFGCYGNRSVKTPHIDALAQRRCSVPYGMGYTDVFADPRFAGDGALSFSDGCLA